mgnify:FL=1|tara:strand:+ start:7863 stop:8525 length:663 start_codon:yes stop_codon:yes gene_type:complete
MDALKRKMKFLATKLSALQSEIVVSREIFHAAHADVKKMFDQKYFPEIPVKNEEKQEDIKEYSEEEAQQNNTQQEEVIHEEQAKNQDSPETQSAEKIADPEVKKMFKKIALQCHPDKIGELEEGFEKKKKEELYSKARQALESNDVVLMADVANELGVEVPEITVDQLKQTEQKIIAIKNELHHIESTLVWHWFFTEDLEKKETMLTRIFELMYANNPRS